MFKIFKKNKYNRGITMIELIVVISIFLILTSITIFNYGQFRSSLSIQNLADDISLVIRKAQSYSTGVQQQGEFSGSFGVHFTADDSDPGHYYGYNKQFILFFDRNKNLKYDYSGAPNCGYPVSNNECFEALKIKSDDRIAEIYVYYSNGSEETFNKDSILNVVFIRPNTEPFFCKQLNRSAPSCSKILPSYAKIRIRSNSDDTIEKNIYIYNNGQISVSQD
jgi:prepilin-type N-terminal cleavage/methylation domain-containing protein